MIEADTLTPEQRAVVHHGDGPAAVLAVPGAGKTTAVAHRVRFLVETEGVTPGRILVSSFNRGTVEELETRLATLGVPDVELRTLHGLGHLILRRGGMLDTDDSTPPPSTAAYRLARRALRDVADERDQHPNDLDPTAQEVADQVAAWKQQLAYQSPSAAPVPPAAYDYLRSVDHEDEELVELFRRFEAHRERAGWWTFADLLRDGWAALVRDESLRKQMQGAYTHVIVDEFQDVGRAQFHLLDLLTASNRNYMAVGDDDQSIYGWRGADPSYLRGFARRYDGEEYKMQASFRLPAAPLVLANGVRPRNSQRRPKRLHLTQGFDGNVLLMRENNVAGVADQIGEEVDRLRAATANTLEDAVVLMRTYAQSPPIERALVERDLPYRIRGGPPFYRRRPVQTLLQYLYWAVLEQRRREEQGFDDPKTARRYTDRFSTIINRPNRYVERPRIELIARRTQETGRSALSLLDDQRSRMPDDTAETVDAFRDLAAGLVDRLDAPPHDTLEQLVDALDYEAVLRERAPTAVRGELQVRAVQALLRLSASYSSAPALLRGVRSLAQQHERNGPSPTLDLRSIHRAKGAEWSVVFIPDCTEGIYPLEPAPGGERDLEEERRLFYVALTRTRQDLRLGLPDTRTPSRFLEAAEPDQQLAHCTHVRDALRSSPNALSDRSCARLCHGITVLHLAPYIQNWWTPQPEHAAVLLRRLSDFAPAMKAARARQTNYQEARDEYTARLVDLEDTVQSDVEKLRQRLGTPALPATLKTDAHLPRDARFRFQETADAPDIQVLWDDRVVGQVDLLSASQDTAALLDLPWACLVARLERVRRRQDTIRFRIDWGQTQQEMLTSARADHPAPDPPDETTRLLAREEVRTGYETLRDRLITVTDADET